MTTTNKIVLISASALLLLGGAIYYRKKIRGTGSGNPSKEAQLDAEMDELMTQIENAKK
jgi:hypothetical protein